MWSGERLTKIQATTRPDHVCPEVWTKIGKDVQNREKQEWAKEKPKLDNARKMRGIYFIDPDDEEYNEILRNARRKLERPMAPTMPKDKGASRKWLQSRTVHSRRIPKQCVVVFVESHFESTRQRAESSQSKNHEDHLAGISSVSQLLGTQVHPDARSNGNI